MDILEPQNAFFLNDRANSGLWDGYFPPEPLRFKAERQPFSLEKNNKIVRIANTHASAAGGNLCYSLANTRRPWCQLTRHFCPRYLFIYIYLFVEDI